MRWLSCKYFTVKPQQDPGHDELIRELEMSNFCSPCERTWGLDNTSVERSQIVKHMFIPWLPIIYNSRCINVARVLCVCVYHDIGTATPVPALHQWGGRSPQHGGRVSGGFDEHAPAAARAPADRAARSEPEPTHAVSGRRCICQNLC